jgi:hypothetical protein
MKAKSTAHLRWLGVILMIGLAVGCSKARNDAQVASDVQSKIYSDAAVQSRQISVQSQNGVVTLNGSVGSEQERNAAAAAAAQVEGVKTVVNNLQATQPQVAQEQPQAEPAVQEEEPAPAPVARKRPSPQRQRATTTRPVETARSEEPAPARDFSSPEPAAAPAPPPVQRVTVPDGTLLSVRLVDEIDSETAQDGEVFRGTLNAPIVVDDQTVIPGDADIEGRVVQVQSAGRFKGQSLLTLELNKIMYNGRSYNIKTNQWSKQGSSRGKATAAKVGGGAALGAIIGGLAGGGKGAAIGATVGAGAGTGVSAATKGQQIKLGSETVLSFQLESPVTVTPAASSTRNAGRRTIPQE